MFQNLHEIKEAGFDCFKSIEQLWQDNFPLAELDKIFEDRFE
jgi:hypothetical protein